MSEIKPELTDESLVPLSEVTSGELPEIDAAVIDAAREKLGSEEFEKRKSWMANFLRNLNGEMDKEPGRDHGWEFMNERLVKHAEIIVVVTALGIGAAYGTKKLLEHRKDRRADTTEQPE